MLWEWGWDGEERGVGWRRRAWEVRVETREVGVWVWGRGYVAVAVGARGGEEG